MKLHLANGQTFEGHSFAADREAEGEVVFTTGMTGYLEILTDPSYYGQIVVFTFPLIGNYGAFDRSEFARPSAPANKELKPLVHEGGSDQGVIDKVYESQKIWVKGVILAEPSELFSHELGETNFATWLKNNNIPALAGVDTRALTQELREHGVLLGKIGQAPPAEFTDPLNGRYVPEVSPTEVTILEPILPPSSSPPKGGRTKTIAFIDCGAKNGIFRNFLRRGVRVIRCPFDQNPFELDESFDGIFLSNGPGDPATVTETIEIAREALAKDIPMFGICLGNQMLAIAAGGKTHKMKYGHRGINQPVQDLNTKHCLITTQNHGYEVDTSSLSTEFDEWMINLNDRSNEGIRHKTKPVFAVQFHPEACAGPEDAQYLFDEFIAAL